MPWQSTRSRAQWYSRVQIYFCNTWRKELESYDLSGVKRSIEVAPIRDKFDKCVVDGDKEIGSMTKIRCRICELLGENQGLNHGLSHPCHLTNLNHLRPGLNYSPLPNMNYLNHGLLNGLYLPQLKDMMLAAYLLRGKNQRQHICRQTIFRLWVVLTYFSMNLSTNNKYNNCLCYNLQKICSKNATMRHWSFNLIRNLVN